MRLTMVTATVQPLRMRASPLVLLPVVASLASVAHAQPSAAGVCARGQPCPSECTVQLVEEVCPLRITHDLRFRPAHRCGRRLDPTAERTNELDVVALVARMERCLEHPRPRGSPRDPGYRTLRDARDDLNRQLGFYRRVVFERWAQARREGAERARAVAAAELDCQGGAQGACVRLAALLPSDDPRRLSILQPACEQGGAFDEACTLYREHFADRSFALARQRCAGGDPMWCVALGTQHAQGRGARRAPREAQRIWGEVCRADPGGAACMAALRHNPGELTAFEVACRAGQANSCRQSSESRLIGECVDSCAWGGALLAPNTGRDPSAGNARRAAELFDIGCRAGSPLSCSNLLRMLRSQPTLRRRYERVSVMASFDAACRGQPQEYSCAEVGRRVGEAYGAAYGGGGCRDCRQRESDTCCTESTGNADCAASTSHLAECVRRARERCATMCMER